ncbi:MAG: transglycosylase SLT domain-containing protein [bacterium]|nr:transglycosylase SLT domain-containing protein [bacterium]
MRFTYTIITITMLFLSCMDNPTNGNSLSSLGFYSTPDAIIKTLNKKSNQEKSYHEHFMLGIAYKQKKKYKKALFHFSNSCFTTHRNFSIKLFAHPVHRFVTGYHFKSEYYNDALYHIAHLFYLYREHAYVIKFVDCISDTKGALYRDAVLIKTQSLSALKKKTEAIALLKEIKNSSNDKTSLSLINIRLASLYEKTKQYENAAASYREVLKTDEKSWQAGVAAKRITGIMAKNTIEQNSGNTLLLGKSLYHAKKYTEALSILQSLYNSNTGNAEFKKDVQLFIIKTLTRQKKNKAAESFIKKAKKNSPRYYELMKTRADEFWAMRKKYKSIPLYKKIIKSELEPIRRESLRKIAMYMEDRRKKGYRKYLIDYSTKYETNKTSEYFLWLLGRNSVRDKQLKKAVVYFRVAIKRFPDGYYTDRCRFWLNKLQLRAKDYKRANKTAIDLVVKNPDSYYTWRLLKNIKNNYTVKTLYKRFNSALSNTSYDEAIFYHTLLFVKEKSFKKRDKRLKKINDPGIQKYNDLERSIAEMDISSEYEETYKRIKKYFVIGWLDGIQRELKTIPETEASKKDTYTALAHYARTHGNYFLAVKYVLELQKLKSIKENIALLPERSVKTLFPLAFKGCVAKYGKKYKIDNNIIYSVIKAESLFNHRAVSSAKAVGLMQLMPATARGIAKELKIKDYDLKNPCHSIYFGTKYIAWLKKYFKGDFELMVAGYNAGAGNVNKWKKKLNLKDKDYFSEFVPFYETRYYILRTGKFLTQYRVIYAR